METRTNTKVDPEKTIAQVSALVALVSSLIWELSSPAEFSVLRFLLLIVGVYIALYWILRFIRLHIGSLLAMGLLLGVILWMAKERPEQRAARVEREIATQKLRERDATEDKKRQLVANEACMTILGSVEGLIRDGNIMGLAKFAYDMRDNMPSPGTNEGCGQLRTGLSMMLPIWESGEVPPPAEFERAGRFFKRARVLLQNPEKKMGDFE